MSSTDPTPSTSTPPPAPQSEFVTAVKSISPITDLANLPQVPGARYALLFGIVAGVSIGSLRFVFARGGKGKGRFGEIGAAANWAVGSFGVASLGAWEVSRRQQTSESTRMNALVSEVKARRAARPAGTTADRIGGVLIGDKGREMAKDGTISVRKAEMPKKVEEKSWYRKFI